jgi:hypothetical protein
MFSLSLVVLALPDFFDLLASPPATYPPGCRIIGNPSWDHYCQDPGAAVCWHEGVDPGGCVDTQCRTSTAPMNLCCTKECCPVSCQCIGVNGDCQLNGPPCCIEDPSSDKPLDCIVGAATRSTTQPFCNPPLGYPPPSPSPPPACFGDSCSASKPCCANTYCTEAYDQRCHCGHLFAVCDRDHPCCEGCVWPTESKSM